MCMSHDWHKYLLFCFGSASSHPVSIPLEMARLMKVRNLMLSSLISALRAWMGWKMSLSMLGVTREEVGSD